MSDEDGDVVANDAKELIALCRAGRLYEIEKWISEGKSLDISGATKRGRQKSLLEIAVEVGFHSLVELIAKHETSQAVKDAALGPAVSSRRLDLIELLLANGANIKSVPLADVLLCSRNVVCRTPFVPIMAYPSPPVIRSLISAAFRSGGFGWAFKSKGSGLVIPSRTDGTNGCI